MGRLLGQMDIWENGQFGANGLMVARGVGMCVRVWGQVRESVSGGV